MPGDTYIHDPLREDYSLPHIIRLSLENLIHPNHNIARSSLSSQLTTSPSKTDSQNALITVPPTQLELRQNNPQDCSNLIIASVDRATVEISRTIIALNATFSQQLQQASISASNGIKSAQGSASSTIAVVVQSASIATSSAFSSVTVANLAVTNANLALTSAQSTISSVNLALTSVASASSSDVLRLSSSLSLLQASIISVQASASTAIAAAQSALASATESAASQASSILASAASPIQSIQSGQPLPALQAPPTLSITPAQAVAIVIGAVIGSILLSIAIYFLFMKRKRDERNSYLDEKEFESSPRNMSSRLSSTIRTGNSMVIKFNPPKSSNAPTPIRSALRRPEQLPMASLRVAKKPLQADNPKVEDSSGVLPVSPPATWPFTLPIKKPANISSAQHPSQNLPTWPLGFDDESRLASTGPIAPFTSEETSIILSTSPPRTAEASAPISSSLVLTEIELDLSTSSDMSNEIRTTPAIFLPTRRSASAEETIEGFLVANSGERADELLSGRILIGKGTELIQKKMDVDVEQSNLASVCGDNIMATGDIARDGVFEEQCRESLSGPVDKSSGLIEHPGLERPRPEVNEPSQRLSQQPAIIPMADTLFVRRESQQSDYSTIPGIDELVHVIVQQNKDTCEDCFENPKLPHLEEVEREFAPSLSGHTPIRDSSNVRNPFPLSQGATGNLTGIKEAEGDLSGLKMHSVVGLAVVDPESVPSPFHLVDFPEIRLSSPPTHFLLEQRDISPLRRNPVFQNMTSMLAEDEIIATSEELASETGTDGRGGRGRSMIRTSDIIEARLSGIVREEEREPMEQIFDRGARGAAERIDLPLRRNSVDFPAAHVDQRDRTVSPLRRNPVIARQASKASPEQEIHSLLHSVDPPVASHGIAPQRYNNLFGELSSSSPASELSTHLSSATALDAVSNVHFSETLSKFQTLASQNPVDTITASNEVTQRAIAGIFIPGSLREQAVRNLSRSRERGKIRGGEKRLKDSSDQI